jgi:hypothetical protein
MKAVILRWTRFFDKDETDEIKAYADKIKIVFDAVQYRVTDKGVYISPPSGKCEICALTRALQGGYDPGEDVTPGLVPQDNEIEAVLREASTYDAKKLAEVRKLWENIPRKEVE